jgi:alpha-galactosidase
MGRQRVSALLFFLSLAFVFSFRVTAASQNQAPPDLISQVRKTPFSFIYDDKSSRDFIGQWKKSETSRVLANGINQDTITYTDPRTKIEVVCEISQYPEFHAAEWVLHLKNNGVQDTPMIEDIRALDLNIPQSKDAAVTFHSAYGTPYGDNADYTPIEKPLHVDGEVRTSHYFFQNGQHSFSYLPFFNVQWGNGGLIGAIGWTGQWMLHVQRSEIGRAHV